MNDPLRKAIGDALEIPLSYPTAHKVGMKVPKGGSACAKCEYWRDGQCHEKHFIEWHGSGLIPENPDEYCCDFFEARKVEDDALVTAVGDALARIPSDVEAAFAAALGRRFGEEPAAESVRAAASAGAKSLDKRFVTTIPFGPHVLKVFTVNGENVRTRTEDGGQGCTNFTMGMNGMAAREPIYRAEGWCLHDEICLHNLLSPVDFLAVLVHELVEWWGMKFLGLTYDVAHEYLANLAENVGRGILARPEWQRRLGIAA